MTARPERLGVFGGTFDPPHIGHLVAALYSFEAISLDRLMFVVANVPWQKVPQRLISPVEHRLAMVRAAIADQRGFEVSTVEIERAGNSYMVDTLQELRLRNPGSELFLIVGADAAAGIPTWHQPERLAALATVVVVDRAEVATVHLPGFEVRTVPMPAIGLSSTALRARVGRGGALRWQVPPAVDALIQQLGLYRRAD
ncbi:MAG: nicotinate-nucleotide adenylyltransferase [Acidimicrobiales bacterium]